MAARREREKKNTKLNGGTKVEESEMRRDSRAKMKMDGTKGLSLRQTQNRRSMELGGRIGTNGQAR